LTGVVADERWNHNIHYHPLVLASVPAGARTALDVGCGEGMLARALRTKVPDVIGLDLHEPSIEQARGFEDDISYVVGDVLKHDFERSFDFIASVATLHHMDAAEGLARFRTLLSPGGRLVVIGCARFSWREAPYEVAGLVAHRLYKRTRSHWEHPSPTVWPPPVTFSEMRSLAVKALPGAKYRRHALWRYSLTWQKPH
jgi:2-polyprenyl-3-methyl-5-hydroxy-6-metoxy-1,4-benzoquinol methylase